MFLDIVKFDIVYINIEVACKAAYKAAEEAARKLVRIFKTFQDVSRRDNFRKDY